MVVDEKVSYPACNEAYCLLTAYLREEGKVGAKYSKEDLTEFVKFLADILKHPENFTGVDRKKKERHADGSLKLPDAGEHDGLGLA
jgi:hypothetical protein